MINAGFIGLGSVNNATLDYVKNVSSDIQGQINTINSSLSGIASNSAITTINANIVTIQGKQTTDENNIASNTTLINVISGKQIIDEASFTKFKNHG